MTSKTAQMYLDAAARVPEMDDDELAHWYAEAVQQYTALSLWRVSSRAHVLATLRRRGFFLAS